MKRRNTTGGFNLRNWSPLLCACCFAAVLGGQCGPTGFPVSGGQLVFTNLNAALLSVTGTSATNVYVVGADPGDGRGPYVLHYDGQAWERLETGATGDLWWISVAPIGGSYYMVGSNGLILSFRPDTGEFLQHTAPTTDSVFGVWGADSDNIWAVGGDLENQEGGGFIWRYDGDQWSAVDASAAIGDKLPLLYKVWGRSASDVYAVGRTGLILHFDGNTWKQVATDTARTLFTVHGDETDVIAVGGLGDAVIEELEGDAFVNRAPANLLQVNGIYVRGLGEAVAAGNDGTIVKRSAAGWNAVITGFSTTRDFHGAWMDPEGGIWAVGGNLGASLNNGMIAYVGARTISDAVR